jgi:hypothetical protein
MRIAFAALMALLATISAAGAESSSCGEAPLARCGKTQSFAGME